MVRKVALTLAVAVFCLASLAVLLTIAAGPVTVARLAVVPFLVLVGFAAAGMIGRIWNLEGQWDHGEDE
jgi:uncharacterized membrane protein YqjE